MILKQSTSVVITFGPFVDKTDGVTLKTALAGSSANQLEHTSSGILISKNGGTLAARHATATASVYDAYGMYKVTLDSTDTGTCGILRVVFADAGTCLPVWQDFQVVEEAVYDALYGASALGPILAGANSTAVSFTGGMTISNASGTALTISSSGSNGHGIAASGNGSGEGISATGGATGHGIEAIGGSTSGSGISAIASTSGSGIVATGVGTTKPGIIATGGATTSAGIEAIGGSTSGDGLIARAATSGKGIVATGIGTTMPGVLATGGATTSAGIEAVGGSTSGDGLIVRAATSGKGLVATGVGTTMAGIIATGGSTSSAGISAAGGGTGAGFLVTGGATGAGFSIVGGSTSGVGIGVATTSGDGVSILPTAGNGIVATANGTDKIGMFLTGGSGIGDAFKATAGGTGVQIRASITGDLSGGIGDLSSSCRTVVRGMLGTTGGDVIAELTGLPGATPSIGDALMLMYMALRNAHTSTSSVETIKNNAGTAVITAALSDDGTTFTKAKFA